VLTRYSNTIALPHLISLVVLTPNQINKHPSWLIRFAIWNTHTHTNAVDGLATCDVLTQRHDHLSLPRSTFDMLHNCHASCVLQIQLIQKPARDIQKQSSTAKLDANCKIFRSENLSTLRKAETRRNAVFYFVPTDLVSNIGVLISSTFRDRVLFNLFNTKTYCNIM
jgi:hypothetical protein